MSNEATQLELFLPGEPLTRREPLLGRNGPYPHPKTRAGIDAWRIVWMRAGRVMVASPIILEVYVRVARPPTHLLADAKGISAAGRKHAYPPTFDISNVLKLLEDALKGHAMLDDSHVVAIHATKQWVNPGDERKPGTYVSLRTSGAIPTTY